LALKTIWNYRIGKEHIPPFILITVAQNVPRDAREDVFRFRSLKIYYHN
jgi:hypothetical protein